MISIKTFPTLTNDNNTPPSPTYQMSPSHIRKPHSVPIPHNIPVHSPYIWFKPDLPSLCWYQAILTLRSAQNVTEGNKLNDRVHIILDRWILPPAKWTMARRNSVRPSLFLSVRRNQLYYRYMKMDYDIDVLVLRYVSLSNVGDLIKPWSKWLWSPALCTKLSWPCSV